MKIKNLFIALITILISFFVYNSSVKATSSVLVDGPTFYAKIYEYCNDNNFNSFSYVIFGKYSDLRSNLTYAWGNGLSVSSDDHTRLIKGTYNNKVALYVVTDVDTIVFNSNAKDMLRNSNGSNGYLKDIEGFVFNNIDTSNVTNMKSMFANLKNLKELDLSNFNTSNVTDMSNMFSECESLTSLNVSSFNTSSVTDMSSMFSGCKSLTSLNLSNFYTSSVTDMSSMFSGCTKLESLNISNFNTTNVTDMSGMFNNCQNLTSINVSSFNTSKVTDMSALFSSCYNLTNLDITNFDTSNVTDMAYMFQSTLKLSTLDLSSFNTSKVTDMRWMFNGTNLQTIYALESFVTTNVSVMNSENMFQGATELVGGNGFAFDSNFTDKTYARIDYGGLNRGYFTEATRTVTFNTNGGTPAIPSQSVRVGTTATKPTDPTRSGYKFNGWYLNGSYYYFSTPVTDNITLVANWRKIYTVNFVPNNGTTIDSVTVTENYSVSLPTVTKDGYEFGYWAKDSAFQNKYTGQAITSDTTLYAKWYLKYDWNDNDSLGIDDIISYRQYLAGVGDLGYSSFEAGRKKALNADNNTTISILDLINARIALANT